MNILTKNYRKFWIKTADPDDNKFVDCSFAGNAYFLVTDDKHYNIIKSISFPSINIIGLDEFKKILSEL
jgi:uncharacterized protein